MMTNKIFYSWQSEMPKHRDLLRDALTESMRRLPWELELDESTRGVPGSPSIFQTITKKIDGCAVFIADLTICGSYFGLKSTPNPNVLVEYGYALKALGTGSILTILNRHFGTPEDLPFDLKGRAVNIIYDLAPGFSDDQGQEAVITASSSLVKNIDEIMKKTLFGGLSPKGAEAVKLFVTESVVGSSDDPAINFEDFCTRLRINELEAMSVIDDLDAQDLIKRIGAAGNPLLSVQAKNKLFWHFDRLYQPWINQTDAASIAKTLVGGENRNENQLVSQALCDDLIWEPRRLNPALSYLVENGIVRADRSAPYPFLYYSISEIPETRRYVKSLEVE